MVHSSFGIDGGIETRRPDAPVQREGPEFAVAEADEQAEVDLDEGTQPVPALEAILSGDHVLAVLEGDLGGAQLIVVRIREPGKMRSETLEDLGFARPVGVPQILRLDLELPEAWAWG